MMICTAPNNRIRMIHLASATHWECIRQKSRDQSEVGGTSILFSRCWTGMLAACELALKNDLHVEPLNERHVVVRQGHSAHSD